MAEMSRNHAFFHWAWPPLQDFLTMMGLRLNPNDPSSPEKMEKPMDLQKGHELRSWS